MRTNEESTARTLETALGSAYATSIPETLQARLDARILAAISAASSGEAPRAARGGGRSRRRRLALVPLLGLLAAVVVAAGSGLLGFYSDTGGYAWSHGTVIAQTTTVGGRQITLERAYADINQMMLAVTVADEAGRVQPDARYDLDVVDSTGQTWRYSGRIGASADDPTRRGTVTWFEPDAAPAAAGTRHFTATVSHVRLAQAPVAASSAGPLPTIAPTGDDAELQATFGFDLSVLSGAEISPEVSAVHDGVTVTLTHVVISPTMIRADLRWTGMPAETTGWGPEKATWQQDGRTLAGNWGGGRCEQTACWMTTNFGSDKPGGRWTLTIDQFKGGSLVGFNEKTDNSLPRVVASGPFVLQFTIP